jgi:1,4-alpha-glucan branching enzyme
MLPLSHDEVVHGKSSLIFRMPGDEWQRFANLRLLYAYMFTHPGTKLLFMGGEFAQTAEWNYKGELQWHLLQYDYHKGIQQTVRELNALYREEPALFEKQFTYDGFEWNDLSDHENCVIIYYRKGKKPSDSLVVILNMTPAVRHNYVLGVFESREWKEIFNSDQHRYGGSGVINYDPIRTRPEPEHGKACSLKLTLPPLGAVVLKQTS